MEKADSKRQRSGRKVRSLPCFASVHICYSILLILLLLCYCLSLGYPGMGCMGNKLCALPLAQLLLQKDKNGILCVSAVLRCAEHGTSCIIIRSNLNRLSKLGLKTRVRTSIFLFNKVLR